MLLSTLDLWLFHNSLSSCRVDQNFPRNITIISHYFIALTNVYGGNWHHVTYTSRSVSYNIPLPPYHHIIQVKDMYLLLLIEILVGDFGLWPSDVLSALFLDLPTDHSIRKLASFFYGNGVPLRLATRLSTLCNPFWNHHSTADMKHLYHLWHAGVDSTHHANYWNTRYG